MSINLLIAYILQNIVWSAHLTKDTRGAPVVDVGGGVEDISVCFQQLPHVAALGLHHVVLHSEQAEGVRTPGPVL